MGKVNRFVDFTLLAAGASFEVSVFDNNDFYRIIGGGGAALLAGNTFVLKAGETAYEGATMSFRYEGNVVPGGGNNVVILGQTLSAVQSKKQSDIVAIYRSGAWEINISIDLAQDAWLETTAIAATAYAVAADITTGTDQAKIVTAKAVSDWWTAAKLLVQTFAEVVTFTKKPVVSAFAGNMYLSSNVGKEIVEADIYSVITKEISFEAGELGNNSIIVPYGFDIMSARAEVGFLIDVTDNALITLDINGVPVTTGVITIPGGSATDTVVSITPTANKTGATNAVINCVGSKAIAGGKAHLQIVLKRVLS